MSVHTPHPRMIDHGLCDDCHRCAEIAVHPFENLDDDNLRALVIRTQKWMRDQAFPRSTNETTAMRVMEKAIVRARAISRVMAEEEE